MRYVHEFDFQVRFNLHKPESLIFGKERPAARHVRVSSISKHHALLPRRIHQSANSNYGFCDQRASCKFLLSALWSPIHLWSPPRYFFRAAKTIFATPPDAHYLSGVQFILGLYVHCGRRRHLD